MKLLFTALLCLLLWGCAPQKDTAALTQMPITASVLAAEHVQAQYGGAVKGIPLPLEEVHQLLPCPGGFLLHSDDKLVMLDDHFQQKASLLLTFQPQIRICGDFVSAFDPGSRQVLLLNNALEETRRLTLPEDVSGSPVLSSDAGTLYYCTSTGIYAWDLENGIRRRIKESSYEGQSLVDIHWEDQVLQCRIPEESTVRNLFLDTSDGHLLQERKEELQLSTVGSTYYCTFSSGSVQNLLFGTDAAFPRGLFPDDLRAKGFFLPQQHSAVTLLSKEEGTFQMDYYRLDTGFLVDSLELKSVHTPKAIISGNGDTVLLLVTDGGVDVLLQWQPQTQQSDSKNHTDTYYTAENPDHAGLTLCREFAEKLSEEFGLEILLWKDAAAIEPWDYTFEPEHRYPVILEQLQTLEQGLRQYPLQILADTASHFDSVKFCLVREIRGIAGVESLSTATGIQFLNGNDAYVVLAAGPYAAQALYHELFHVMETHILGSSNALDRWNELNPSGFSYDLDHSSNAKRNSGVYLETDQRAFVDTYSMSFPKEDRARIFEYAMLPGQEALFRPKIMQSKLQAICTGIREAYGLKKSEECFLWEQYLQ